MNKPETEKKVKFMLELLTTFRLYITQWGPENQQPTNAFFLSEIISSLK